MLLHSLVRRDLWYPNETISARSAGGTYGVRFQQLPHATNPVSFDFSAWLADSQLSNVTEVTLDLNTGLAKAQMQRLKWKEVSSTVLKSDVSGPKYQSAPATVSFDSELIRSFVFDVKTSS